MSLFRARIKLASPLSWVDFTLLFAVGAAIFALVGVAEQWAAPFRAKTEIDLGGWALVQYSLLSLVRVTAGYFLSLAFTLVYGYLAAKSRFLEPALIALLDILQSVPVLGFMPGLVLALVGLFPNSNLGLELAAVVMIFTGQGWNMVFSFYSSLKSLPEELREMARNCRLSSFEILRFVEVPFSVTGLLWNSMMSMAGGWFFLMVIESFSLGKRDFRLPGIGSYMAVAYEQGDFQAVGMGVTAMFVLIVLVDRCVFAPLVVWAHRFHFDTADGSMPQSFVYDWLKRSRIPGMVSDLLQRGRPLVAVSRDAITRVRSLRDKFPALPVRALAIARWSLLSLAGLIVGYGCYRMGQLVTSLSPGTWLGFVRDTGVTLLRVIGATVLGALWAIPVGVFIGTHPVWTRRLQPLVQVVASFPAPMLFPVLTALFLRAGFSLDIGAVILMLFACQWYILFNVIAGATQIPGSVLELARAYRVRGFAYWRSIALPAIFPSLLNGLVTAAGGAWNACIVAEVLSHDGKQLVATGIGATITTAAQNADYAMLGGALTVMVTTVVLLNRLLWGSLYRLAERRFRWEY